MRPSSLPTAAAALRLLKAVLLLALALGLLRPAAVVAQSDRATVRVDGRPVFRVGGADSSDAAERALRIENRLGILLENPRAIGPARVERTAGRDLAVSVSGVSVVTVTPADAEDNVTSLEDLAVQWARAIDAALASARERRLSRFGRFGAEVRGAVTAAFSRLAESAIRIVPRALAALLVLALFWLLAAGARRLMRFVFHRIVADLTVENLIQQTAFFAIWTLGLIVTVDALGFRPQSVATGLGLTGLALGFALKDIISNFVSGLLILSLRPFEIGDQIVVGETEGNVERIELRATQIRTYGGRLVLVPNAELFTSRVTNNTASPVRRTSVRIFLGYGADLRRALTAARSAAQGAEGVLEEPPVSVRLRELGASDLVLEVRFWADSRRSDLVATQSNVRAALLEAFRQAGIGLPEPDLRRVRIEVPPNSDAGREKGG